MAAGGGGCIPAHLRILELPVGRRDHEHSQGTVCLALNEALKVTEEGRALTWGSGSPCA